MLDGLESFLRGVKHLLDHRDYTARARGEPEEISVVPKGTRQ